MRRRWLAGVMILLSVLLLGGQGPQKPPYALGDIPLDPETYQKHLKVRPMDMAEALPTSYDARAEGIVTPAKDQEQCGSCWAFASVGAMESHILKAYGAGYEEDLSEQQQVSCNTAMYGCSGGNSSAIRYWEPTGPLYEGCFPYTASDGTPCAESVCEQLGYLVTNYHTVPATPSGFKTSLYNDGPSYWRYTVHSDFFTFWNTGIPGQVYVNQSNSYEGGHAVLLIGWDDTKAAYLCKNSWGEAGGPNNDGTFWIAYEGHANNLSFGMANFSLTSLTCFVDAECDDGVFCNGAETCVDSTCQAGTPPDCPDDDLFCNGTGYCDAVNDTCGQTGDPCDEGTVCNEDTDTCDLPICGNDVCEAGEDCNSCSEDCTGGSPADTDPKKCFKGEPDGVCHPKKENDTCPDCAVSWCCGDGVCEGEEDSFSCAIDCGAGPGCGDGTCDPGEDQCSCSEDCGTPFSSEAGYCNDETDNDCDGSTDCDDSDCGTDPACQCSAKGTECQSDNECCSNKCRGGKCR